MHHYRHNIGDYRADTGHLSLTEHGIYRQLLDTYYLDETPLCANAAAVARKLGARTDAEAALVQSILAEFFTLEADGWHHKRCDAEIAAYRERAMTASENGRRGGRVAGRSGVKGSVDSGKPSDGEGKPKANRRLTEGKANHKPITNNHSNPPTPLPGGDDLRFCEFWDTYPKRRERATAWRAWSKLAPDDALALTIIESVKAHARTEDWTKESGRYVPYPASFLNAAGWLDEIEVGSAQRDMLENFV